MKMNKASLISLTILFVFANTFVIKNERILQGPQATDTYKKAMVQTLPGQTAWCICVGSNRAYSVGITLDHKALCSTRAKNAHSIVYYNPFTEADMITNGYQIWIKRWDYGEAICGKTDHVEIPTADGYKSNTTPISLFTKFDWCSCKNSSTVYPVLNSVIGCSGYDRELY